MSRFPEDHHTSTVEGAAAWECARGESDDCPYGLDEAGWDRYLDARDEREDNEEDGDGEEDG